MMKRMLALTIAMCLLLCGCSAQGQRIKDPVTFYYVLEEFKFGEQSGAFAAEEREAAGHQNDLKYLLSLYLIGPTKDGLRSPFPWGIRIISVEQKDSTVELRLTDTSRSMSDVEFTQASACLTLTCLSLTDAKTVSIRSGSRSVTMSRDSIILFDDTIIPEETQ